MKVQWVLPAARLPAYFSVRIKNEPVSVVISPCCMCDYRGGGVHGKTTELSLVNAQQARVVKEMLA